MAKKRGWWSINLHDQTMEDLSDTDKEHIADLIKKGFTSGEIVRDEE